MTYQNDTQAIEKACRRLTMKWEPIWNITHRYLYCRCVLGRSTPSQLCPEITALINARCPRHNSGEVPHADYGDIDYHQDRYFDQFGGYNAFRGMVFGVFPSIYLNVLGRYAFIPMDELDTVMKELVSAIDRLGETFQNALDEYTYEILQDAKRAGVPLPSHAVEFFNREEKVQEGKLQDSPLPPNLAKNFLDSPMMREVEDIQLGRWSRKPHWTVDNC